MTVIDREGFKVNLPRRGCDAFWRRVQFDYVGDDDQRWQSIAMLALREALGWNTEHIGRAFGLDRGQISRRINDVKRELRAIWSDRLDFDDDGFSDPDDPH